MKLLDFLRQFPAFPSKVRQGNVLCPRSQLGPTVLFLVKFQVQSIPGEIGNSTLKFLTDRPTRRTFSKLGPGIFPQISVISFRNTKRKSVTEERTIQIISISCCVRIGIVYHYIILLYNLFKFNGIWLVGRDEQHEISVNYLSLCSCYAFICIDLLNQIMAKDTIKKFLPASYSHFKSICQCCVEDSKDNHPIHS